MKQMLKKVLSSFVVVAMLVGLLPAVALQAQEVEELQIEDVRSELINSVTAVDEQEVSALEASTLEEGKYNINVNILKETSDDVSIMQSYLLSSRLEVTSAKMYLYLLMNGADSIQNVTVEGVTASVVEDHSDKNIKRYKVEVSSISTVLNGTAHVIVNQAGVSYNSNHSIRFAFDTPEKVENWTVEEEIKDEDENEEEVNEIREAPFVRYVNYSYQYDTSVAKTYIHNFETVEVDGKYYVEFDAQDFPGFNMDLKMYVTNPAGTLDEGSFIRDVEVPAGATYTMKRHRYEVTGFDQPIVAKASYKMPMVGTLHEPLFYIVINHDVDALVAELKAEIAKAKAVSEKTDELTLALAYANSVYSYLSTEEQLQQAIAGLKHAQLISADMSKTTVALSYVKADPDNLKEDKLKDYQSAVGRYFKDALTYTINEQTYLQVSMQDTVSLTLTLEGSNGATIGYLAEEGKNYFIKVYEINELTDVYNGAVAYRAGAYVGGHDFYLIINQDAKKATREALTEKINEAKALYSTDSDLLAAIASAEAVNHLVSREAQLQEALTALTNAMESATGVGESLLGKLVAELEKASAVEHKTSTLDAAIEYGNTVNNEQATDKQLQQAIAGLKHAQLVPSDLEKATAALSFVKAEDKVTDFQRSVGGYFKEAYTYTLGEQNYLQVWQQDVYDLAFTLEDSEGATIGYVTEESKNYFVKVYEINNVTDIYSGSVSYFAMGATRGHNFYLIINQDATTETRKALADKIKEAEALNSTNSNLLKAISNAEAVNHLVSREAQLQGALTALTNAIKALNGNGNGTTPTTPSADIHEASGLEVGKYDIDVSILHSSKDEASIMQSYLLSARLQVTKTKLYLYLLMDGADMIQDLYIDGVKATVAENYSSKKIKRYKVEVSAVNTELSGSSHVIVNLPGFGYDENHSIRFKFGTPSKVDNWTKEDVLIDDTNPGTGTETGGSTETEQGNGSTEGGNSTGSENTGNGNSGTENKQFTDTSSHWAKAVIERAVALGITNGYADGSFKPEAAINRAEFTALIARAMKLESSETELNFTDAQNIQAWAKPFIQQAVNAGIIGGYSDQTFRPAANISRVEMAVMIVRALGLELEAADSLTFADAEQMPSYAKAYVATAVKHGLVSGLGNNRFGAQNEATRAEAITMILRAFDYAQSQQK